MYEGENKITFSKETINKLFSKFMTGLFHAPITVTDMDTDYKGCSVEFTANTEAGEAAKDAVELSKESEVSAA